MAIPQLLERIRLVISQPLSHVDDQAIAGFEQGVAYAVPVFVTGEGRLVFAPTCFSVRLIQLVHDLC
ncbi:6-phospho-3-hexuloisomerase, partial [Staphylococcus pseudintermedius]